MSSPPQPMSRSTVKPTGRGTRTPELARLLAIHGARQMASTTAMLVRDGDPPILDGDEPARMLMFFAARSDALCHRHCATGAFHKGVSSLIGTSE